MNDASSTVTIKTPNWEMRSTLYGTDDISDCLARAIHSSVAVGRLDFDGLMKLTANILDEMVELIDGGE